MRREIEFIDLIELEKLIEEKESERAKLEEIIEDAKEFLNNKYCDVGTFYINSGTCIIYFTPLGDVTEKVFRFLPFASKDKIPLKKAGKLIPEIPIIKIRIPEEIEYPEK